MSLEFYLFLNEEQVQDKILNPLVFERLGSVHHDR